MLAVPNFSEGRDEEAVAAISEAFARGAAVLDRHTDAIHNRTVLTLSAPSASLTRALTSGAAACAETIDMRHQEGAHPRIGALDVCPVVYLTAGEREAARAEALTAAEEVTELGIPVFFYGELASAPARRERAYFRRGGVEGLAERMRTGELVPDLGPPLPHASAGATLVTARPPLVALNIELDTGDVEVARAVASRLREGGGGPVGVRAIGIDLDGTAQVSVNVHDPVAVPLAAVIARVRELAAEHGARPVAAELVGLAPEAAARDLPADVPLRGFDPELHLIERRLRPGGG